MILKHGEPYSVLPEAIDPSYFQLLVYPDGDPEKNPASYGVTVLSVPFARMKHLNLVEPPVFGAPVRCAVDFDGEQWLLWLHPTPDQDYHARFRYCPAMKEI